MNFYFDSDDSIDSISSNDKTNKVEKKEKLNLSNEYDLELKNHNKNHGNSNEYSSSNQKLLIKHAKKINIEKIDKKLKDQEMNYNHKVMNSIKDSEFKQEVPRKKNKDKHDRATVEQVLDARTRVILVKLMNNKFITEINGCLSTGKRSKCLSCLSR